MWEVNPLPGSNTRLLHSKLNKIYLFLIFFRSVIYLSINLSDPLEWEQNFTFLT